MLKLFEKYGPDRANAPTTAFTNGSLKNESVPGANDGTPLDQDWGNDYAGWDAALLSAAGITANGNVDTAQGSQRLEAMLNLSGLNAATVADAVGFGLSFIGLSVYVKEYSTGTGGGAWWDYVDSATNPSDGIGVITTGKPSINLKLRTEDKINVRQMGAGTGLGTDGTIIQYALDLAEPLGRTVFAPYGIYILGNQTLTVPDSVSFIGAGGAVDPIISGSLPATARQTLIEYSGTGNAIEVRGTFSPFVPRRNQKIGGFRLLTRSTAQNGMDLEFMTRGYLFDIFFDGIPQNAQLNMKSCYNNKVERCFLKGGQTYNLFFDVSLTDSVFSGQTLFEKCDFWAGGTGTYLNQSSNIVAQITFDTCHWQDNVKGFEHDGGRQPVLLDPHFENNDEFDFKSNGVNSALIYGGYCNSPSATAGRVSIEYGGDDGILEGMGFNEHITGDAVKLSGNNNVVRQCNFRKVDGSTRTGIRVTGDNNQIEVNSFVNNTSGSQDCVTIESGASRTRIGYQDFDASVTGGRVTNNSSETLLKDSMKVRSDQIDLAGSAYRIAFPSIGRVSYLTSVKLVYPSVISGGTGVTLEVGKSDTPNTNDPDFYLTTTTAANVDSFTTVDLTGSLPSDKSLGATDVLNITAAGGEGVAAVVMVEIELLPYRIFD